MDEKTKNEFKELIFAGYYDEMNKYTVEILKEQLIKFLKDKFEIDHIKII